MLHNEIVIDYCINYTKHCRTNARKF